MGTTRACLGLQEILEVLHVLGVLCHVRAQHHVDEATAHVMLPVDPRRARLVFHSMEGLRQQGEPVTRRVVPHGLETQCKVHVLEDALVIVADSLGGNSLGEEEVAPPRVPYVVDGTGDEGHDMVQGGHLLTQVASPHEPLHGHHHIHSVEGIVIRDIPSVELADLTKESHHTHCGLCDIRDLTLVEERPDEPSALQTAGSEELERMHAHVRQCGKGDAVKVKMPSPLKQVPSLTVA
mmetsp:Transcript_63835/g.170500  ORF Transcript_63835/g.170500 Transcript_63835/m.170500 type:complete len:237 (+) Transcript_63835:511-1221(+)